MQIAKVTQNLNQAKKNRNLTNKISFDNEWTYELESQIANKGNNCTQISLMHQAEADRCHKWDRGLAYIGITLSVFLMGLQLTIIIKPNEILNYISMGLILIQSVIIGIAQFSNFSDNKIENLSFAADFDIMREEIIEELTRDRSKRRPALEYQKYINEGFNKVKKPSSFES